MIEHDLPFTASKAQRLMKIASDPRLSKAAHGLHLPDSWRTLCELTKLDEETFDRAVSAGAIHPEMTRKDAKVISIRPVDKTIHIGPVPVYSKKTEPIPVSVTYERNEPTVLKFVAPAVDFLVQDILKALVAASINNASLPTVEEMEKFVRGYGQLQPGWLYNFAETMTALAQELERSEKASRLLSTSAG